MAGAYVSEFSDENFEAEVKQSAIPVLVDFWAEWCGPCRMLGPTIEKLAEAYQGKVKVGKLNVDHSRKVAIDYRVTSIPTVLLFKGGQVVAQSVGLRSESDFRSMLDKVVAA